MILPYDYRWLKICYFHFFFFWYVTFKSRAFLSQFSCWWCYHCLYVLVAQSCPTLCDPMDCSPPGSSVHRILQARILEWTAISLSNCLYRSLNCPMIVADGIRNFRYSSLFMREKPELPPRALEEKLSIFTLCSIIHQLTNRLPDTKTICDTALDLEESLVGEL